MPDLIAHSFGHTQTHDRNFVTEKRSESEVQRDVMHATVGYPRSGLDMGFLQEKLHTTDECTPS